MFKKKAKPAPADAAADAPRTRSKLKLIFLILVPLVLLGGGGYAGWVFFLAAPAEAHVESREQVVEALRVAALAREAAAESSATYNFALAQMLQAKCGALSVKALKQASEDEAGKDGMLVSLSWQAALRRAGTVTEVSCERILGEIDRAEYKLETEGAAKAKAGGKAGH